MHPSQRRLASFLALGVLAVGVSVHSELAWAAPFAFTAPAANAVLPALSMSTITWTGGDSATKVNLQIMGNSPFSGPYLIANVAMNIANAGSFTWKLPATLPCNSSPTVSKYHYYIQDVQHSIWLHGPNFTIQCPVTPVHQLVPVSRAISGLASSHMTGAQYCASFGNAGGFFDPATCKTLGAEWNYVSQKVACTVTGADSVLISGDMDCRK